LPPLIREPFEGLLGVAIPQLRSGVAARSPFGEDIHRRIEPYSDGLAVEQVSRARVDVSAAAGRDDSNFPFYEARDKAPLAVAEIMFAIFLEDFGGREAGRVLDCRIAVDE
jgi:hypothetical protein